MDKEQLPYVQVIEHYMLEAKENSDKEMLVAAMHDANILIGLEHLWSLDAVNHPSDPDQAPS